MMPVFSACIVDADLAAGGQLVLQLGEGLNSRGIGIRFPTGTTSPSHSVHIGSGFHPASYPVEYRLLFPQR
jgi:hypothetical protein